MGQACVWGEEPRAPPPPPKPTSCVVEKTPVLPPPPLPSAQSEAEGPVCLQIPLLLPSLSLTLSVFPHPRIYHTLVLSLTPSAGDSWLLLMSFKLNAKRVWKRFIWKFYIWKVLILYLCNISVCFCLSFSFSTLKYMRGFSFSSPLALCVVWRSYTLHSQLSFIQQAYVKLIKSDSEDL